MKKILKLFMILLSYAPISTVSVAAQSKVSELEGVSQNRILIEMARQIRYRLLPNGHQVIDVEAARQRYSELTGLDGDALEDQMNRDIQFMIENGYIQFNEKWILSESPSHIIQG